MRMFRQGAYLVLLFYITLAAAAADQRTNHVVFRSIDGGRSWTRSNAGLPGNARVNALASFGGNVLAGTDSGIFTSTNAGTTWVAASNAAPAGRMITFAAVRDVMFAGSDRQGILASSDRGHTWRPLTTLSGSAPEKVRSLFSRSGALYAGTDGNAVFRSLDQGQSWTRLERGLPVGAQVFAMAEAKGTLFAALYSKGLYRWSEQEDTWIRAGDVRPLDVAAIDDTLVAGHNPGGIFWSDNLGVRWTHINSFDGETLFNNSSSALPANAPVWDMEAGFGRVFAGAADGIFYSEDQGRTWVRARAGLPDKSPGVSFLITKDFILAGVIVNEPQPE